MEETISNWNKALDSAWHCVLLNTAVSQTVIKKGSGLSSSLSL